MIDLVWLNQALADPKRCGEGIQKLFDLLNGSAVTADFNAADRKDLVQEAALSLWQFVKNGGAVPNVAYLFATLKNKKYDLLRRRKRDARDRDAFEAAGQGEASVPVEGETTVSDLQNALAKLRDRAVADRKPHLRAKLRADCDQLLDVAAGIQTMSGLIDRELATGDAPPPTSSNPRETIQDRLLQRHQQARKHLNAALDNLIADGEIPSDQRPFYEMILQKLLRRQNKRPRASKQVNSDA